MDRATAIAYRIHAQQLNRPVRRDRALTGADILDFGVQDTGRDGASWALANRGVRVEGPDQVAASPELVLVWTLRSSPHYYRRADLADVLTAVSPLNSADAGKRILDANRPLHAAGIDALDALAEVASAMRAVVTKPVVKGEVSAALTARMPEPYLRHCVPCQAIHPYEVPFRMSALYAGLELEPGTSPPVLRRIPDWPRRSPGPAADPLSAPARLQPIRNYLRFLGPATPQDVAAFLDAPVKDVRQAWPQDAVPAGGSGPTRWLLESHEAPEVDRELLRLLSPYDLLLQGRDRDLLVPDRARHKALWPVIGRPGAILSGDQIVGLWRPKTSGSIFTVRIFPWTRLTKTIRERIDREAERLAAHRGLALAGVAAE